MRWPVYASLIPIAIGGGFLQWRSSERARINALCTSLLKDGYVELESLVSQARKESVWTSTILPHLVQHWEKTHPGFKLENTSTWPAPSNGKSHEMTSQSKLPGLPGLVSESFDVQAVTACMFDSSLSSVHFGPRTHWRLRLFVSVPWFLGLSGPPADALELAGVDQSWHIANFPNPKYGSLGATVPYCEHVDKGNGAVYKRGMPCTAKVAPVFPRIEDRMVSMSLHQLGVLIYGETPGDIGPAQGATGLFKHSHFAVCEALRTLASVNPGTFVNVTTLSRALSTVFGPKQDTLVQPTLRSDRVILMLGPTAHVPMWALEPMPGGQPRVIQNCKLTASLPERTDPALLARLVSRVPADAGVRRVWGRPMEFAREVLPEADLARVTELSALIVSAVGKIMESDSNKNSDAAPPAS